MTDVLHTEASIDALLADPSKAAALPPDMAQALLIGLASIQPILITRALMGSQNKQDDAPGKTNLTAQDVAPILNVKLSMVYELARTQRLKSYKVGKYLRFTESSVREFLAQGWA